MEKMIANLLEAYRQSISQLEWMTPATRQEALAKLAKFSPKIAYPPKWRDYSSLEIRATISSATSNARIAWKPSTR
jgi:putative endopeptidase